MKTPRLFFLGTPKFELGNTAVEPGPAKAIALLAWLASAREPQPRERILGLLWADSTDTAARKNLRNILWTIRKALGEDAIRGDNDHLALGASVWADTREFEKIPDDLGSIQIEHLKSKIELYRAPLLDGLTLTDMPDFEIWLTTERERFAQLHLRALDALVKMQRASGDWRAMAATAQRALAHDNLQEPMSRALMEAHARLNERANALRQYDTLRETLARELGVEPLPETETLRAAIISGELNAQAQVSAPALTLPRPTTSARAPFVGRTNERAALDIELGFITQGHARVTLLIGELGIGKSRLWREWSEQIATHVTVLETRCLESTQALPLAPLIEMFDQTQLRTRLFTPPSPVASIWLTAIAQMVPNLRATLTNLPPPATLPADEERHRLFEALTQCLIALGNAPLILFIDDAHWADRATLDWLDYTLHRLHDRAVLVILAYRAEDASAALVHLIAGWGREGMTRQIPLARLSLDESAALIVLLGGDPALAKTVETQSGGNPYFLIELHRAAQGAIPAALTDLVRARLATLPDTARQVVQAAAILEPDFDLATLRRTSGRDETETLDALDALLNANVLVEHASAYQFSHPLVAAIVRDSLSGARRAFLHRRAAEALETTHSGRLPPIAGLLTAHYTHAHDRPRAAHFAQVAAEHALALASPNEAQNFYQQAIALEPTPARQLGLGKTLLRLGNLAEARAALIEALAGFERANDHKSAVRVCLNIAETCYPAGLFDEGRAWMEKGLAYLDDVSDPEAHAIIHQLLGARWLDSGQHLSEAEAHLSEATQIATANHLPTLAARSQFVLGNLRAQRGDLPGAIQAFQDTITLAQTAGDDYQQVLGYNNAAYHSLLSGDRVAAHQYIEQGLALAETRALRVPQQYLYSTRGEIALAEKNWDEATAWFMRGLAEAQAHGNTGQAANYHANLALAARGRGKRDQALAWLEQAYRAATLTTPHLQTQIDLWLAELYLERGERAAANEALTRAEKRLRGSERGKLIEWAEKIRVQVDAHQAK